MITGAHSVIYSKDPEADRAFFRDVLNLTYVDAGHGWLIFGLPPAEVAVHPAENNGVHEFFLMCDDLNQFISDMQNRGVNCGAVHDQPWGALTEVPLPGGGKVGVYQPRHARPEPVGTSEKPAATSAEKASGKSKKSAQKKGSGKSAKSQKKSGSKAEKKKDKVHKKHKGEAQKAKKAKKA